MHASTASRQFGLSRVGSRKSNFKVDQPPSWIENREIENRTSPIAWVKYTCQVSGPGEQDPEFGHNYRCQSSTSGRGPARLWGRNTTTTSHATTVDGLVEHGDDRRVTQHHAHSSGQPASLSGLPAKLPGQEQATDRQPVQHATHDLDLAVAISRSVNVGQ